MSSSNNKNKKIANGKRSGDIEERESEIEEAEKNLEEEIFDESAEIDDFGQLPGNEFSEIFNTSSRGNFLPLISDSSEAESLEQVQTDIPFGERKKQEREEKEAFQDHQTTFEPMIREQGDLIAPIDDMRRMNMFLDAKIPDMAVDTRPTVNITTISEMLGLPQEENMDIVKYSEIRKDPWIHDITEADKRRDVRKYFKPKI